MPSDKSEVDLELKSKLEPVCKFILVSALALVKYKLLEPSAISSVSNTTAPVAELTLVTGADDCVKLITPVELLYEISPLADIADLLLAFVK